MVDTKCNKSRMALNQKLIKNNKLLTAKTKNNCLYKVRSMSILLTKIIFIIERNKKVFINIISLI